MSPRAFVAGVGPPCHACVSALMPRAPPTHAASGSHRNRRSLTPGGAAPPGVQVSGGRPPGWAVKSFGFPSGGGYTVLSVKRTDATLIFILPLSMPPKGGGGRAAGGSLMALRAGRPKDQARQQPPARPRLSANSSSRIFILGASERRRIAAHTLPCAAAAAAAR